MATFRLRRLCRSQVLPVVLIFAIGVLTFQTKILTIFNENAANEMKRSVTTTTPSPEEDAEKRRLYEKYTNYTIPRTFTPSENSTLFILDAVGKNSSESAVWDTFSIYGQWFDGAHTVEADLRCCFRYSDGTVLDREATNYRNDIYPKSMLNARLLLWHVTCPVPRASKSIPVSVSVARYHPCESRHVNYVRPHLALKLPPDYLVITTKLTYVYVKPEIIISYMEYARFVGVNKVLTYVLDSLHWSSKKVLLYYASIGLVEYHNLTLVLSDQIKRDYIHLCAQYMSDEWLTKKDSIERYIGSTYLGIFDMDEYLIPSGNRSLQQLLTDLRKNSSFASHFFFRNVHFLTDVSASRWICGQPCSLFRNYTMLAPQVHNGLHEKMIVIPSRIKPHTINNHYVASLSSFTRYTCPPQEAYVRHYGACSRKFSPQVCKDSHAWVEDMSMSEWAGRTIQGNIERAKTIIRNL